MKEAEDFLLKVKSGEIKVLAVETVDPSPIATEILRKPSELIFPTVHTGSLRESIIALLMKRPMSLSEISSVLNVDEEAVLKTLKSLKNEKIVEDILFVRDLRRVWYLKAKPFKQTSIKVVSFKEIKNLRKHLLNRKCSSPEELLSTLKELGPLRLKTLERICLNLNENLSILCKKRLVCLVYPLGSKVKPVLSLKEHLLLFIAARNPVSLTDKDRLVLNFLKMLSPTTVKDIALRIKEPEKSVLSSLSRLQLAGLANCYCGKWVFEEASLEDASKYSRGDLVATLLKSGPKHISSLKNLTGIAPPELLKTLSEREDIVKLLVRGGKFNRLLYCLRSHLELLSKLG